MMELRMEKKLSRAQIAFYAGTDEPYIQMLEAGMIDPVDGDVLVKIARVLGVRLIELTPTSPEPKRFPDTPGSDGPVVLY